MSNFFTTFLYIFSSSLFVNLMLFEYVKSYVDENAESMGEYLNLNQKTIQDIKSNLDKKSEVLLNVQKNLEESATLTSKLQENIELKSKTIGDIKENLDSGLKNIENIQQNLDQNYDNSSSINRKIQNQISNNIRNTNKLSQFNLLRQIKNTNLINVNGKETKVESTNTYTIKLNIQMHNTNISPPSGIDVSEQLTFVLKTLFYINGYVIDQNNNITCVIPIESFTFPEPNILHVKQPAYTPKENETLCVVINGIIENSLKDL